MAKLSIMDAVADALLEMGVESVTIDRTRNHGRILWSDRGGELKGIITVPKTPGDRRSLVNNITMARRIVRTARGG